MKKYILFLYILVGMNVINYAQNKYPLAVSEYKLDNGFTIWINEDHTQPKVFGVVVVNAGSKDCPDTGIAHYFEHIMFKGTDRIGTTDYAAEKIYLDSIQAKYDELASERDQAKRKDIQKEINRLTIKSAEYVIPNEFNKLISLYGGTGLNAFTSYDMTAYHNEFSPQYIAQWAEINSHRLLHPVFRLFQSELETVYEEKNMRSDALGAKALEKGMERYFQPHPYAYPIIGSSDNLKNPRLSEMEKFFKDYYVAGNMCLILSGDIRAEEVMPILQKTFGRIRPGKAPVFNAPAPPAFHGQEKCKLKLPIPILKASAEAWRATPTNDPDELPLQIACKLLSNDNQTGYIDKLVSDGKIMAGGVENGGMDHAGFLAAFVIPKILFQSNTKARKLINAQIERIKNGDFSEEEFNDIKLGTKRNYELQLEDISQRAFVFFSLFTQGKSWNEYLENLKRVDRLTKQDIVAVANKYFTNNYLLLQKKTGRYPKDRLQKPGFDPIIPKNTDAQSAYAQELARMPIAKLPPRYLNFTKDANCYPLTSLVNLYCTPNPVNDVFTLKLNFAKGSLESNLAEPVSNYLNLLGTDSQSFEQFKRSLQQLGSTMSFSAEDNVFTLEVKGFDENLAPTLHCVGNFMKHVKSNPKKLKQVVDAQKVIYKTLVKSPQEIAQALAEKIIYGERSRYLRQLSIAEMKRLKADVLLEEFRKLSSIACDIHYCGNLDDQRVMETVKENFSLNDITQASNAPYYRPTATVAQNTVYFIDEPSANQSAVLAYIPGEVNADELSRNTSALFNDYFGNGMSSILFQEVREFRSLAYNVGGKYRLAPKKHPEEKGYLYLVLSTQSDKTTDAIALVDSLLQNMPAKPDKITLARQALVNSANNDFPSFRNISLKIAGLKQNGETEDPNIQLVNSLPEIGMENIESFYQKNIRNHPIAYIVVGNSKSINMEKLKAYGEIKKLKIKDVIHK